MVAKPASVLFAFKILKGINTNQRQLIFSMVSTDEDIPALLTPLTPLKYL